MPFPAARYEELLQRGSFGEVRLGAGWSAVIETAGAASDEGHLGRSLHTVAFDLGHLQVTFHRGEVVHFGLYFRHEHCVPVLLPDLELTSETSPDDLRRWMADLGIPWRAERFPGGARLHLGTGAVAVFEAGRLESVQVS